MDDLECYLQKVMDDMNKTWPEYKNLEALKDEKPIPTQPMPFFGDIENAPILTVGVNPSADEFNGRNWHGQFDAAKLRQRLMNYFQHDAAPSHEWFDTWIKALKNLGASYQAGEAYLAAHTDLSPRATKSMGSADPHDFLTMVKADTKWFFELVPKCKAARLMLISGTVTKCYYMNDFIKRIAATHGFQFEGDLNEKSGKAKTGYYYLRGPGVDLPVFFCSVSPSNTRLDENKIPERLMLVQRVEEHKDKLLRMMNERPASAKT